MKNNIDIQAAVLAGGQSRRMGQDKSFVLLNGKPMIHYVVEQLRKLDLEIMIITDQIEKYQFLGCSTFVDEIPNKGSIGGLYTALLKSHVPYLICVACDMPFLNVHLLKTLIDLRLNHDAVVPNALGKLHPLHAVYSKTCLPVIRQQIEQEQLRIIDIFSKLSVRYLEEPQLRQIDPQLFSLLNLNRPQDIQSAFEEGALLPPE